MTLDRRHFIASVAGSGWGGLTTAANLRNRWIDFMFVEMFGGMAPSIVPNPAWRT